MTTLIWSPGAAEELRKLSTRRLVKVLNNIALLADNPRPAQATAVPRGDGLFALKVDRVAIHYDIVGETVRILMIVAP